MPIDDIVFSETGFRKWLINHESAESNGEIAGATGRNSLSPIAEYFRHANVCKEATIDGDAIIYQQGNLEYRYTLPRWANKFIDAITRPMKTGQGFTVNFYMTGKECLRALDRIQSKE